MSTIWPPSVTDGGQAWPALVAFLLQVHYLELRHLDPVRDLPAQDLYVTFYKEIDRDAAKNMAAISRKQWRMVLQGDKYSRCVRVGAEELLKAFY